VARSALPRDVSGFALFLDIDGTLLDIAATPDSVSVPPGLITALTRVAGRLGGALALVTGRPVETVDRLFPDVGAAVSGLHGAEWRDGSGRIRRAETTPGFIALKSLLARKARHWPGVVVEDKGAAFAVHYRLAPRREASVRDLMARSLAAAGGGWVLQEGKQVMELRPRAGDKGDALDRFMGHAAFAGRRPLAVGDDLTDEAMFAAASRHGGLSIRVGGEERPSLARHRVGSPAEVRAWIERIAT
jgi:trehalose 6-phosphate phosphatase